MRKLIVANFISLDGFVAGPGGDLMVMPFDTSFDDYNLTRIRTADTLLAGRTTFEMLTSFWIPLADDPAASDLQREIGRFNRDAGKFVISDSLDQATMAVPHTTIVRRNEAVDQVAALKQQPGRDIICFGSRTTWNPLLAAGQVDELHLMIGSAAIGTGVPAFTGPTGRLRLIDTSRADGSDSIVLRYATD